MVRYRKPVERSEHIIDRRGATAAETAAAKAMALATQARWAAEAKRKADQRARDQINAAERRRRLRDTGRR